MPDAHSRAAAAAIFPKPLAAHGGAMFAILGRDLKLRHKLLASAGVLYLAAAVSCGARSELDAPARATAAASGSGGAGGGVPDCAVFNSSATLAPLDVFIMMDSSGSMALVTEGGIPKWLAVRNAFEAFFYEPESKGMGVALSFFPIIDDTVPELCSDDIACGLPNACKIVHVCLPAAGNSCTSNANCSVPGDSCQPLGFCANAPNPEQTYCQPAVGFDCPSGQGPCLDFGYCENHYTCDVGPYATPLLGMATIPTGAPNLLNVLDVHGSEGATPTLPALTGAISGAVNWSKANPDHKVIVVLATDGLPTICDPALESPDPHQGIVNLAQAAAGGLVEGIETFVIGVFSSEEQSAAQSNLNEIAVAGGSDQAYVIATDLSVTQKFLEALNEVRLTATSCEFGFEIDGGGEPVDYSQVWVRVTDTNTGEAHWVKRVSSEAACDPQSGGFYYDKPPGGPTPPGRITLCPASCELLGASVSRTIEIYTTCEDPTDG
jgi:hypothetical protein